MPKTVCPHCRNPVEIATGQGQLPISCPACNGVFFEGQKHVETRYAASAGSSPVGPVAGINSRFCFRCGAVIFEDAVICPKCGVQQTPVGGASGFRSKDPAIAALLCLLWPGAGQIYAGQLGRGITFAIAGFFVLVLGFGTIILLPGTFAYWGWSIYDAHACAERANRVGTRTQQTIQQQSLPLS